MLKDIKNEVTDKSDEISNNIENNDKSPKSQK